MPDPRTHPFSVKIERDLLHDARSRWAICEGDKIIIRSPHSYETQGEAQAEAEKALERHVDRWQHNLYGRL